MKQCFLWARRAAVFFALVSLLSLSQATALMKGSNWAGWRGPEGQGISDEKNLPVEWSESKNVRWKTPIPGRGFSSPIIWGNRVFLTTAIEGDVIPGQKAVVHNIGGQEFKHPDWVSSDRSHTFKVICLDTESGKMLWEKTAYEGKVFDHRHRKSSFASPTATTDGQYVYAYFGSEGLYCYDFKGNEIWKTSLGGVPTLGMGVGTSPVLYENLLIIQCDQDGGENSFITALDKKTGKEAWRQKRPVQVSWTTPVIARSGSRAELITNGNEWIISYDPATGKEWWRCKGVESNAIHTPLVGPGFVIVSAGYPAKRTIAIKLGATGDISGTPNVMWKYEKGTAYVASPILYSDYLYLVTDKGILSCLDPRTGEVKYEGGRVPVPASFMASPVAFEGNILLPSEDGDTFVVRAGLKHEIVRTNSLGEPVYTTPSIAGGKIFLRGEKNLYCIGR